MTINDLSETMELVRFADGIISVNRSSKGIRVLHMGFKVRKSK